MTERKMFLAIDRTLQEIKENKKPFGGLTIVVSGDWRQTLPVIPKANRAKIVDETLKGKIVTSMLFLSVFCNKF